jgi:hypothetical protein
LLLRAPLRLSLSPKASVRARLRNERMSEQNSVVYLCVGLLMVFGVRAYVSSKHVARLRAESWTKT